MEVWSPLLLADVVVIPQAELRPYSPWICYAGKRWTSCTWWLTCSACLAEPLIPIFPRLRYLLTGGDVVDPRGRGQDLAAKPPAAFD